MRYSLLIILGIWSNFMSAQLFPADDVSPRRLFIDQDSIFIQLKFEPEQGVVNGVVDIYFTPLESYRDTLVFDGVNMSLQGEIRIDNEVVIGHFSSTELRIYMPELTRERHRIHIPYRAKPAKGMFFMGWDRKDGNGFIYTQGQGTDNRRWVPHVDAQNDKLKSTIQLTFHRDYQAVANGPLLSEVENDDETITRTYAMAYPHSSYLMAVAIGHYSVYKQNYRGVPQEHFVYPSREQYYASTYRGSEVIFNYLQDRLAVPYPWGVYRQVPVENFPHGAMENTTLTIFSDVFLSDILTQEVLSYTYVNAHELAHHWFGDLVTAPSGHDFWLQESFATYYQWRAEEEVLGSNRFEEELIRAKAMIASASARDTFPVRHAKAGSERFYQKGAYVLRMLELKMGREKFDKAITGYLNKYKFDLVVTENFTHSIESVAQTSFHDFFEAWIEQPGEPSFEFEHQITNIQGCSNKPMKLISAHLKRTDLWPVNYPLTIPVKWKLNRGERWDTIAWTGSEWSNSFELTSDLWVEYVVVDPHQTALMFAKVVQSAKAWSAQLLEENQAGGQWLAAKSLAEFAVEDYLEAALEYLSRASGRRTVRSELIKSILSKNPELLDKHYEIMLNNIDEDAWAVVATCLEETSKHTDSYIIRQIPMLTELAAEQILLKFAVKRTDLANVFFERAAGIAQVRGHRISILHAALGYYMGLGNRDESVLELKRLAGVDYDDMTRALAWQYLYLIAPNDTEWTKGLVDGLINTRRSLRKPAQELLRQWLNDKEKGEWILSYLRHTAKVRSIEERNLIEKLLKIEL